MLSVGNEGATIFVGIGKQEFIPVIIEKLMSFDCNIIRQVIIFVKIIV
jgi:hypothetical protein